MVPIAMWNIHNRVLYHQVTACKLIVRAFLYCFLQKRWKIGYLSYGNKKLCHVVVFQCNTYRTVKLQLLSLIELSEHLGPLTIRVQANLVYSKFYIF